MKALCLATVLCVAGFLTVARSAVLLSSDAADTVQVDTATQFVSALANSTCQVILLSACSITIPPPAWGADPVILTRNITVAPAPQLACRPVLDWGYALGVLVLPHTQQLVFSRVEIFKAEHGIPIGFVSPQPGGPGLIILDRVLHHNEVSPPAQAAAGFFTSVERPLSIPGSQQTFTLLATPWCDPLNTTRCFQFAGNISDVAMATPIALDNVGGYILWWQDSVITADELILPACLATMPMTDCVKTALAKRNNLTLPAAVLPSLPIQVVLNDWSASHAEDPRIYLIKWLAPVLAVILVIALTIVGRWYWLANHSPHELPEFVIKRPQGFDSPTGRTSNGWLGTINGTVQSARRSLSLMMAPSPGGIRLGAMLGAGSFGRVYKGLWKGKVVAVKVLMHSSNPVHVANELHLSMQMKHPNVVQTLFHAKARPGQASFTHKNAKARMLQPFTPPLHTLNDSAQGGCDSPTKSTIRLGQMMALADSAAAMNSQAAMNNHSPDFMLGGSSLARYSEILHSPCNSVPTLAWAATANLPATTPAKPEPDTLVPGEHSWRLTKATPWVPTTHSTAAAAAAVLASPLSSSRLSPGTKITPFNSAAGHETWICMELCEGGSIAAALACGTFYTSSTTNYNASNKPDTFADTLAILNHARDIASGMAYLHSQGIIHGDLKCENVMLQLKSVSPPVTSTATSSTPRMSDTVRMEQSIELACREDTGEQHTPSDYVAKVADFGLSRLMGDGKTHVNTHAFGTVTHCPPELLLKGVLRPAADIYAFGIMLYELGTKRKAFAGLQHGQVVNMVVVQQARPTLPAGHSLPDEYVTLMQACWAQEPCERPTFSEIIDQIDAMLLGVVPEVKSSSPLLVNLDVVVS